MIVGSTTNVCKRWANHKSTCNSQSSKSMGLANHFRNGGCKNDLGKQKTTLKFTLIDFYDTSEEALLRAGHTGGVQCRCKECNNLLGVENKNILKLGTFYEHGLNSRDEIKSLCRCKW